MRRRTCQIALWVLLGLTAAPAGAAAGRPVQLQIRIDGKLPFSKRELAEILRLRLPLVPRQAGTVHAVLRARAGWVTVEAGGRSRQVQLPPGDSSAAARLIALLLVDLVAAESADEPGGPPPVAPPPPVVVGRREPAAPRAILGFLPAASIGARDDLVGFEPLLDAQVRLSSWLKVWGQIGYGWTPETSSPDLTFEQLICRIGVAPGWRFLDLPIGLTVRGYWLHSHKWSYPLITSRKGALLGFTAGLRFTVPLRWLHLWLIVAVDLLAQREVFAYAYNTTTYYGAPRRLSGEMRTSWAVPWFGLGFGFGK